LADLASISRGPPALQQLERAARKCDCGASFTTRDMAMAKAALVAVCCGFSILARNVGRAFLGPIAYLSAATFLAPPSQLGG
jgi:hypothetical protein